MTLNRANELDCFKTEIDLRDFMIASGFVRDPKESGNNSTVLRHSCGDKLIVSRKSNQQYVYWNVHDQADRGTIIDFLFHREPQISLGQIRQQLRKWVGTSGSPTPSSVMKLPPLKTPKHDPAKVKSAFQQTEPVTLDHLYLIGERKLAPNILADPKFTGRVRTDRRGNAIFPHYNIEGGICGFEIKNTGFTSFSPGGTKGLWSSLPVEQDRKLVIAETAIDALSVASLFGIHQRRFVSTAGQMSSSQCECLVRMCKQMHHESEILLAMDNDPGGHRLAMSIRELLVGSGILGKMIFNCFPNEPGEDWNDVLRLFANEEQTSCLDGP